MPVTINGQGPFRFVLDTGANRTVLTPKLAAYLGLSSSATERVTMSGVTGSASVPTVAVDQVKVGEVQMRHVQLPVAASLSEDTSGTLGVDALPDSRVLLDFATGRIQIRKAHRESLADGFSRIAGQCRFMRLLIIRASVGRIPVRAVVDTGSQFTLGNLALRTKLGFPQQLDPAKTTDVIGETLERQLGERRPVPVVRVGTLQSPSPTFIFGDFYVFKLWGLEAEPSIVIGMDMLSSLDQLVIDYQRCEIQVRPSGSQKPFTIKR
ncbi:MAG: aspartyl protease family protein [Gammaproteobacteria bacterium]